jgi:hypothetical protein
MPKFIPKNKDPYIQLMDELVTDPSSLPFSTLKVFPMQRNNRQQVEPAFARAASSADSWLALLHTYYVAFYF